MKTEELRKRIVDALSEALDDEECYWESGDVSSPEDCRHCQFVKLIDDVDDFFDVQEKKITTLDELGDDVRLMAGDSEYGR